MNTVPRHVRLGWETRFPDLSGKWTHWRITGDGYLVGVISGDKLLEAMRMVEANYYRYTSIKCCRAAVDEFGTCIEAQEAFFEIANVENDKRATSSASTLPGHET